VRISAVRTALTIMEAERANRPATDETDELVRAFVPDGDPELALLRATYRDDFLAAFRAAVAGLSRRDRGLVRFIFVEHLTPGHIGAMYGVHRTTAMRWIEAARDEVLAQTRARMMDRLNLSPSECDAVFALVRSRIDFTLTSLLESSP